jgi:hypothetical protein
MKEADRLATEAPQINKLRGYLKANKKKKSSYKKQA